MPKAAGKGKEEKAAAPAEEVAFASRLPAGRHGLPREFIVQNQRERIITALVDTVAERGYNATTVAHITKAASVSRRTFYEHFPGKEACFLAAYEMVADHIRESMQVAAEAFEDWPQKVRAALATMLRFLAGEPELARVCMIEPIAAGGAIAARHRESMQGFIEILKAGRPQHSGERPLPEATEATLVGGIVSLIVREINAGRAEQLEKLLPDLVELTLAPYLGAEEAARLAQAG
ncbi:MAG TPA: TetR/AcrR family transcriptional regulator [Solirubrobacterales bacterium]|nr:TetR/AcrR family transcriptional regulator [Solirubrobacterales bacterium]